jgi:hypothetical protein
MTGKIKVTVSKDRGGYVRPMQGAGRVITVMELESLTTGAVLATLRAPEGKLGDPFRPTGLMEMLSKVVEDDPAITLTALRSSVSSRATMVDLALARLIKEGFVDRTHGSHGAKLHTSIRPFRSDG